MKRPPYFSVTDFESPLTASAEDTVYLRMGKELPINYCRGCENLLPYQEAWTCKFSQCKKEKS